MMNPTYFLIGAQRSGSTLLRLMLNHHPAIAHLGEFNWVLLPITDDLGMSRECYWDRIEHSREFRYSGLTAHRGLEAENAIPDLLDQMYESRGKHKPIVGITLHFKYRLARRLWPNAKFIHLVRDPRDVAPSVIQMGWAATSWHAIQLWLESEDEVEDLESVVPPETLMRIRYEDLVRSPERELGRICAFLGLMYDEKMLSYPEDSTYPAPDASLAQKWRTRLLETAKDVQLIEARATARMVQRGYEDSGLPRLSPGACQRLWLGTADRAGQFMQRMKTYGVRLSVGHAIANRTGLKALARRFQRRMQDIDQMNLR